MWHVACASLLVRVLAMKASGAIYGKTVQEQCHGHCVQRSRDSSPTFLRSASFGGISVLLFPSDRLIARGFGQRISSLEMKQPMAARRFAESKLLLME